MSAAPVRRPLIAGNWKMHLDHLQAIATVQKLAWTLQDAKRDPKAVEVSVHPPFTDLRSVQLLIDADRLDLALGAQDLSPYDAGAYTGDVSGAFLAKLAVRYVIVGHSERREGHHEDDAVVHDKVAAAHRHGLIPILCVGESAEDREARGASAVPVEQLDAALAGIELSGSDGDRELVVAYEPIWAIGSGAAATPDQAQEVCAALRDALRRRFGDATADRTRVLYGGSVKSGNIAAFMRRPDVDGALVGGASLEPQEFAAIVRFPSHITL